MFVPSAMYPPPCWSALLVPACCSCVCWGSTPEGSLDRLVSSHCNIVPRLPLTEVALKVLGCSADNVLCLELLGRAENDNNQSHCPLNLIKAVVQHPALWCRITCWHAEKAEAALAARLWAPAAWILRAALRAAAFAAAGGCQPIPAPSPSQQSAAGIC